MNRILNCYVRKFNSEMYNGVKIAYNAFDSIISELDDYEILAVRMREGCTNGQGYKRFAIIYDIDKIREIKHYFEKILSNEFVKLIEEELKEVKKARPPHILTI